MFQQQPEEQTLIYLHIPKCGGMTLNSILKSNYARERRFLINPSDIAGARLQLANMPKAEREQIDLLHGHLSFGWHKFLPQRAVYITIMRHPLERVVSHYNYVRFLDYPHYLRETVQRNKMSIAEYVSSGICDEVNNGQVRLLAGVEDIIQKPYGNSKLPYGTNNPELLEQALQNINEHFAIVGLQERFDETLLLLRAYLGVNKITYQPKNVSSHYYKKWQPSNEDIAVIRKYNQLDIALYKIMRERFEFALASLNLPRLQLYGFRLQNWTRPKVITAYRQFRQWAKLE